MGPLAHHWEAAGSDRIPPVLHLTLSLKDPSLRITVEEARRHHRYDKTNIPAPMEIPLQMEEMDKEANNMPNAHESFGKRKAQKVGALVAGGEHL